MIKEFVYLSLFFLVLFSSHKKNMQSEPTFNYLPLGDSYTIGTGAKEQEAWPELLVDHLNENKIPCRLIANPARNGYSTQDLIDEELPLVKEKHPDLVTLLIGVNDWVRGVPEETFSKNVRFILDQVQAEVRDPKKIIVVSIPDFGVTPAGKQYAPGRDISAGISEFNEVLKAEAKKRKLSFVDIFENSKKMGTDHALVARDGLHPSAKGYAEWERLILPVVMRVLK